MSKRTKFNFFEGLTNIFQDRVSCLSQYVWLLSLAIFADMKENLAMPLISKPEGKRTTIVSVGSLGFEV